MNVPLSAVLAPQSDSWRRRYERMRSSCTILGDYRNHNKSSLGGKNHQHHDYHTTAYPYFNTAVKKGENPVDNTHKKNHDTKSYALESMSDLYPWMRDWNMTKKSDDVCASRNNGSTQEIMNSPDNTSLSTDIIKNEENKFQSLPSWGNDAMYNFEKDEGFMEAWKVILKSGQGITAQIDKTTASSKDYAQLPKVRDLLILVGKAFSLPKPEDVFGRRDSISKQISQCLNLILGKIEHARGVIANISDAIYDDDDSGIDVNKLSKIIDRISAKCFVQIEEIEIVRRMIDEALAWESKLTKSSSDGREDDSTASEDLHLPQQSLTDAEQLALSGRSLSIRPKSLVTLDTRIQRAYDLRNRIREWSHKVFISVFNVYVYFLTTSND